MGTSRLRVNLPWGFAYMRCTNQYPVCKPIYSYSRYFASQTDQHSGCLCLIVLASCTSYQLQTATAILYGLCRSSNITASLIVLTAWFWSFFFSVIITLHWLNLKKVLCILFIIRRIPNFYDFYEQLYWFNCCLCSG